MIPNAPNLEHICLQTGRKHYILQKEAACYSVRAGAVAGGWCRLSWTRGAAAAEGF